MFFPAGVYTIGCVGRRNNVHLTWIPVNTLPNVIADCCFNHLYFSIQCIFCKGTRTIQCNVGFFFRTQFPIVLTEFQRN